MRKINENKGITLVALVITIIVIIVLAGISISILMGQDGIIQKTKEGAENYQKAAELEKEMLDDIDTTIHTATRGNPKVIIKATMQEVEVTSSNISSLIGTEVVYNPTGDQDGLGNAKGHWRIFYLDTTGKYGDGTNTLYLKRDYDTSVKDLENQHVNYTNDITDTTKLAKITECLKKMNPEWGKKDGIISQTNERVCAYYCNPENWNNKYLDSSVAKYAIATPSVEMWMDAYNQWGGYSEGKGSQCYKYDANTPGYVVGVNGTFPEDYYGYFTGDTGDLGPNKIFAEDDWDFMWLASPAYYHEQHLCRVDGRGVKTACGSEHAICPIVALK